jgi:hypothetical protein
MSGTVDGASTKKRMIGKLVGGSQKYWNLSTTGSFRSSEKHENALHPSNSTFSEHFRDHESFANLLSDLQNVSSLLNKAGHVEGDAPSKHFDSFFDELAHRLVQKGRAIGRSSRTVNKEAEQVAVVSPHTQKCLDSDESKCVSSRELGAKRKTRNVAKSKEEFLMFKSSMAQARSATEIVEISESDPSRDSFTGFFKRSSSRRKSVARARRSSAEDDGNSPDSSEYSNSISRRPSRLRTRKQSSRTRATQSHKEDEQNTKCTAPLQTHHRASSYDPGPHLATKKNSKSCERLSSSRLVTATARRCTKHHDVDLTLSADCASFFSSEKKNPFRLATAFRQNIISENSPKNRGGLRGTSPCRRRASIVNRSCHNRLQQSVHNLSPRHRVRVESERLSQSEHLPLSPAPIRGSGRKLNSLIQANGQPPHASYIRDEHLLSAKTKSTMQRSALFEKPNPFVASSDSSNPFLDTTLLFDEVSFEDAFSDETNLQADGLSQLPQLRQLLKSDRFGHSKDARSTNLTQSNVSPCTPVARRLIRRAQALSAMPVALHVLKMRCLL